MIDLTLFCGTDPNRPYLHGPFSQGEWTYAANGHIIVRMPRIDGIPDIQHATIEGDKPFVAAGPKPAFIPLNLDLPKPLEGGCSSCEGRGTEHECPDCECECERCSGSGEAQEQISVAIRGAIFNAKYIWLIQSLPSAKFATTPPTYGPAWFSFDGGDGIVMPMRRPYKHHITDPESEISS